MTRAAILAAALALIFGGWQSWRLQSARADLARVQSALTGYQEADRWRAQEEKHRAAQSALDGELQRGAGHDAPLSDYLRRGAGRVWP